MNETEERIKALAEKVSQVSSRVPVMFAGSVKPVAALVSAMVEILHDMNGQIAALKTDLNRLNSKGENQNGEGK